MGIQSCPESTKLLHLLTHSFIHSSNLQLLTTPARPWVRKVGVKLGDGKTNKTCCLSLEVLAGQWRTPANAHSSEKPGFLGKLGNGEELFPGMVRVVCRCAGVLW
jgi:hypothetical protein